MEMEVEMETGVDQLNNELSKGEGKGREKAGIFLKIRFLYLAALTISVYSILSLAVYTTKNKKLKTVSCFPANTNEKQSTSFLQMEIVNWNRENLERKSN